MTAYWRQLTLVGCNCRQLHRDPSVLFAGYKLPHPLQYKMVVKVRSSLSFLMAKKPAQLHHPIVFYHVLILSLNAEHCRVTFNCCCGDFSATSSIFANIVSECGI